jgi:hypothetical protein
LIELIAEKAVLNYRDVGPGIVDLYHTGLNHIQFYLHLFNFFFFVVINTEVPEELQGKGIAKKLAQVFIIYIIIQTIASKSIY